MLTPIDESELSVVAIRSLETIPPVVDGVPVGSIDIVQVIITDFYPVDPHRSLGRRLRSIL